MNQFQCHLMRDGSGNGAAAVPRVCNVLRYKLRLPPLS